MRTRPRHSALPKFPNTCLPWLRPIYDLRVLKRSNLQTCQRSNDSLVSSLESTLPQGDYPITRHYSIHLLYFQSFAHSFRPTALFYPFSFLVLPHSFPFNGGVGYPFPLQIEDNMNQQNTNSSLTNNSSALSAASSLSSHVAPEIKPRAATETPLPKAAARKSQSPAKASASKGAASKAAQKGDRCRHFTSTGRRCRLAVLDPASGLCFRHVGLQFQPTDEDLSPAFTGLLAGFHSACRIHEFLTQLTVLLVQNRVSTRRAAILAYLGQTLLRTLPAIELELNGQEDEQEIILDLPRPQRDPIEVESPERAMYGRMASRYGTLNKPADSTTSAHSAIITSTREQTK